MSYTLVQIFTASVLIPTITGWVRFKKISPTYFPFLTVVLLALVNEAIGLIIPYFGHYNIIPSNIYCLFESLLITWQFKKWRLFYGSEKLFHFLMIVFVGFFFYDAVFISRFVQFNSYCRILYSFAIVLMSISMINTLIIKEKSNLLKNSTFIICCAFTLFFTYTILVEAFWVYGVNPNSNFQGYVFNILVVINVLTNLLFAYAILWMPKRQAFSLQY